jgi:Mlc titration factor MtfA (ptsG expression regulator)
MLKDLGRWWRRRRDAQVLRERAIPDALWLDTLHRLPFLKHRPLADLLKLREDCARFLDRHEFSGAGGLVVTDEMAVAVAAQACLPVLHLDLAAYDGFVGIVLHPGEVRAQRQWTDEDGIVHEGHEDLAGEAMPGGPVMLAWSEVAASGDTAEIGYNVVIHEFVHVIDALDGQADGVPPLPDRAARAHWLATLAPAHARLCAEVDAGLDTVLDPYGVNGLEEFFAVVTEAFFVAPDLLTAHEPALYALLAGYFRQDPAQHLSQRARPSPRRLRGDVDPAPRSARPTA